MFSLAIALPRSIAIFGETYGEFTFTMVPRNYGRGLGPCRPGHDGRNGEKTIELTGHSVGAGGRRAVYHTANTRGAHWAAEGRTS